MSALRISLIITTYNWPAALELSLRSALKQTHLPCEIVVADDGSPPDTVELVRQVRSSTNVPILHSWQEDRGFRLARSRNKAIVRASGDYIILIDGDILLEPRFIADHVAFARHGYFVQGTRVLLGKELSSRTLCSGRLRIPLLLTGVENKKNCLRSVWLARLFSFRSRDLSGVKTCNFAFWKKDALSINGFNEEFVGWGREDSEFTARLLNYGIRRQNLRFHALGYHLYHPMKTRDRLPLNDAILKKTIDQKLRWCQTGLDQHLA
ncbi:glycosyltransferase family 2 protein [Desulfobulbus alkaliphilus]|uniref:glycosyltransferase family 2 protein n=1 Tax=Desulfobulbus alkaliphilus TaxID=869814 RepID=UPI001962BF78|nr:glycosyltransferase family 2 protein [Desulfobulbus alkaliphilus]MBM9537968.1 glycosyltransferase family 2 protein [Desulfobulbus alkaliphilus]